MDKNFLNEKKERTPKTGKLKCNKAFAVDYKIIRNEPAKAKFII